MTGRRFGLGGGRMLKLPIVYVMLGFRIISAPEPNPGWQPLGVYETKAACAEPRRYLRTFEWFIYAPDILGNGVVHICAKVV